MGALDNGMELPTHGFWQLWGGLRGLSRAEGKSLVVLIFCKVCTLGLPGANGMRAFESDTNWDGVEG